MMPIVQDFDKDIVDLARLVKCIAHPVRISLLKEVARRGECGPDDEIIIEKLSPLTVKQHLREMKKIGLITGRIFGKSSSYSINWERFAEFQKLLDLYFSEMSDMRDLNDDQT